MDSAIISHLMQGYLLPFKITMFVSSLVFAGFFVIFSFKTRWLKLKLIYPLMEFWGLRSVGEKKLKNTWMKISKNLDRFQEEDYKKAFLRLNHCLDRFLRPVIPFFQDENLEQRLSRIGPNAVSTIEQLKTVNKICSGLEINKNLKIEIEAGKKLIEAYGVALKELGII
jgi:hypothetical protein